MPTLATTRERLTAGALEVPQRRAAGSRSAKLRPLPLPDPRYYFIALTRLDEKCVFNHVGY